MSMLIFGQKVGSLKIQSRCKALPDMSNAQKYGSRCVSRSFRSLSSEAQFSNVSVMASGASGLLRQVCPASKDMVRSTLLLFLRSGGPLGLQRKFHDYSCLKFLQPQIYTYFMPMLIFGKKVGRLKIQSRCKALPDMINAQKYGFRCVCRSFASLSSET